MNNNIETLTHDEVQALEKSARINKSLFDSLEDDFKRDVERLAEKLARDVIETYDKYEMCGFSYSDLVDVVATLAGPKTFED